MSGEWTFRAERRLYQPGDRPDPETSLPGRWDPHELRVILRDANGADVVNEGSRGYSPDPSDPPLDAGTVAQAVAGPLAALVDALARPDAAAVEVQLTGPRLPEDVRAKVPAVSPAPGLLRTPGEVVAFVAAEVTTLVTRSGRFVLNPYEALVLTGTRGARVRSDRTPG